MKKYFWSILITVTLIGSAWAGIISKPYNFVDGTVASAAQVNADFDTLYTLVNGNIDNANVSGSAAIVFSKLDTATVAGVTEAQTLTNKTLTTPVIASFYQDAAKTKLMTVPAVTSDTLVTLAASQTLTNKTLTAPVLGGSVTGTYTLAGTPTITSPAISSPTISGSPTAAGSTWTDLGTVSTAAFTAITNLGSVTTADINGGTLDGVTIGGASAAAGSFTTVTASGAIKAGATSNVPTLVPGQVQNLSWTKAAGVITIKSADGTDLSATNPGWVCVPSAITAGAFATLSVTANVTFNDDDHASSHLTNWLFGVTTGVAWNTDMPIFIYAINRNDVSANLVFGISRNPTSRGFSTALIGDKDAVPASDTQGSIFIAASITEADYNGSPSIPIGATAMKKVAAANDWTIYPSSGVYGFGQPAIDYATAQNYTFPAGQNGAAASKYFFDNGGTAPGPWATNNLHYYSIDRTGLVTGSFSFTGGDPNGAGAVELWLATAYKATNAEQSFYGAAEAYIGGVGSIRFSNIPTTYSRVRFYNDAVIAVNNVDLDGNGDTLKGGYMFKAF